ncbi:MAG: glycine dehydrogenase subunit 2, partial [Thermoleophilaceae bacterium]|nr:glycine dehydrogenase subunit 2 [Thermoleophilaceae bacterium]
TLDRFADSIRAILDEAREDPQIARNAPYDTPVRRLDEGAAARRPVVRQQPASGHPPGDPDSTEQVTGGAL